MYFPLGIARRLKPSAASTCDDAPPLPSSLAGIAKLGGAREEVALQIARDNEGELFAVLGEAELSIWSIRPALVLAKVVRTALSMRTLGNNVRFCWHEARTGEAGVVVQTSKDRLLYYSVEFSPRDTVYRMPMGDIKTSPFSFGSGEADQISLILRQTGELDVSTQGCSAICSTEQGLLLATTQSIGLRWISWTGLASQKGQVATAQLNAPDAFTPLTDCEWAHDPTSHIMSLEHSASQDLFVLVTGDGNAYAAQYVSKATENKAEKPSTGRAKWRGAAIHSPHRALPQYNSPRTDSAPSSTPSTPQLGSSPEVFRFQAPLPSASTLPTGKRAVSSAINARLSLIAIGLHDGSVQVYSLLPLSIRTSLSHVNALRLALHSTATHLETGRITSLAWTSDGYALATGWQRGWSLWSVYGRLLCWGVGDNEGEVSATFEDGFMNGVKGFFWGPGDLELFLLCPAGSAPKGKGARQAVYFDGPDAEDCTAIDQQLYSLPLARSAVTGIHSPDNTNQAFLQLDDRVLVYRGADQPDMSVINPESDVWQNIKIPAEYLHANWPIRLACISSDARLIAIAGRRGLTHYNSLSGRWKLFEDEGQEQSFRVEGGMQWYAGYLVASAIENGRSSIRIYARDTSLSSAAILCEQKFDSPVVLLSIFDNSLLVYTVDNTLHHFLINAEEQDVRLRLCSSIGFEGVVRDAKRVRGMSWLVPRAQQRFGDPADDLNVATIIFLIDGKLVLLRPRKAGEDEVKYDMQVLADRTEFYWTHLSGIGALENSLWAWDGKTIRIWLNALTIETSTTAGKRPAAVKESVAIVPDFYPLSVLMDKGVIIGVDHETSLRRTLDFAIFRMITQTHLFLHHVLRFHLSKAQIADAVSFASCYADLVYFAHALEILLHSVLEDEADALLASRPATPVGGSPVREAIAKSDAVLPHVVSFLDHFDEALQVVVGCARKTEIARWEYLFAAVGAPRGLFEKCMLAGLLKIAASYLLVLHNLEPIEQSSQDTVRLLKAAMHSRDWQLCKELLRFLFSLDHTGRLLRQALHDAGALPSAFLPPPAITRSSSAPDGVPIISPPQPNLSRSGSSPAVPAAVSPTYGLGFGSLLARVGLGGQQPAPFFALDQVRKSARSPSDGSSAPSLL